MKKQIALCTLATLAGVSLASCGETKLLGKSLPDETQVIDGPSLALPPSFELRPPHDAKDGTGYEATVNAQQTSAAQALIAGAPVAAASGPGSVPTQDNWILDQAAKHGSAAADPAIRADLTAETVSETAVAPQKEKEKGLLKRWFGRKGN